MGRGWSDPGIRRHISSAATYCLPVQTMISHSWVTTLRNALIIDSEYSWLWSGSWSTIIMFPDQSYHQLIIRHSWYHLHDSGYFLLIDLFLFHPTKTEILQGMVRLPVKLLRFLVKLIFWLWRLGAVPSNNYCSKWLSICELISSTSERWGLLRLSQLTLSSGLTINLLFDRVMPPHPNNNLLPCSPLSSNNQFQ